MYREEFRVAPEQLRRGCDPAELPFETTAELTGPEDIIGQPRAVAAMEFGLRIKRPGYNIFVLGAPGTGRTTYANKAVERSAPQQPIPCDWCYVYNFSEPGRPKALALPGGKGREFCRDIGDLETALREDIPTSFDGEEYERQKARILQEFQRVRTELLADLTQRAKAQGFSLKTTNSGFQTVPVVEGEEVDQDEFSQLAPEQQRDIEDRSQQLRVDAAEIMRRVARAERKTRERIKKLDHSIGFSAVGHLMDDLQQKYAQHPRVVKYLEAYKNDVLENLDDFKGQDREEQVHPMLLAAAGRAGNHRYQVNLLVDNSQVQGAPVVCETNPTWDNLLGRVEYKNELGRFSTDFTKIKAGAFHRANGGYLILQVADVLANPMAWQAVKRVLKNREIQVESLADQYSALALSTLRPEPIPLSTKLILIGTPHLYQLLYNYDDDFKKLFKVKVDFNDSMERDSRAEQQVARFVAKRAREEGLRHFSRGAVAALVEYSSRLADNQQRLSTHFNHLGEIVYEADTWAELAGAATVAQQHVRKAIAEKIYRSNRQQELRQRLLAQGKFLVTTRDNAVGQVNGLSVVTTGDYDFGVPMRITAAAFAGRGRIVNIEREIKLSGSIHSKGVLTLAGYLGQRFAQKRPLALSASITFEQLYGGVEGDSASSAELFALLSSLADIPIDQGLAVTGSVNQKGEIQPVGGINEKIEGWFETCKILGMTGTQGVVIPRRNLADLMLRDAIIQAVRQGQFHIYAIDTVEQGVEILFGLPAGAADQGGEYEHNTVYRRVQDKLERYSQHQQKKSQRDE